MNKVEEEKKMGNWSTCEWILYCGIGMMIVAVVLLTLNFIFIRHRGRKINEKLIKEYGKQWE